MIFWTRGGDFATFGEIKREECPTCEKETSFNLLITYRYFCLYWIFGFITKTKYMICCDICDKGTELHNKTKVDDFLKEHNVDNPIPFMRRRGIFVLIAGIILLIALDS